VRGPLPVRLGDGVERQAASLGHGGTLANLGGTDAGCSRTPCTKTPPGKGYATRVEVLISEGARDYIERHGGTVFVRSHPHRCCTGSLTLLDVRTTPPRDAADFEPFDAGGVGVRFWGGSEGQPNRLTIELRGVLARRPVAFWDGCAFKP
jgi:hypothetical protein